MKKSENWLLSKPYLLNVLYFGSLGQILYSLYNHYSDLEDAVPALIQVLKDQNEDVRWNAVQALEKIDTPEALKALKEY